MVWPSFSVSFFHVSLGLPAPCLPSIPISHAALTAPLGHSTCPNQRSLLSLKMRSRSSNSSFASSSKDLTVATSSGLILQICLIMPYHCAASTAGLSWSVVNTILYIHDKKILRCLGHIMHNAENEWWSYSRYSINRYLTVTHYFEYDVTTRQPPS